MSALALLGGSPLIDSDKPLIAPAWPPICETTAEKLKALYLSAQWSFNCPAEQTFARDFAAYHGADHGVFMVNGTVTLEAALAVCGVGPGDEVILPALTWPATAMAVHYVGATPVFADVEPSTLCLDPKRFEEAITPRTRAVIPVHLYGSTADLEAILAIARKHELYVIEDCAHMQGGKWAGKGVGSHGHIGSFSFQQSKTMASGEGGICLTRDPVLAEKLYRFKHIGYPDGSRQGQAATAPPAGLVCHNYRATGFQAVILSDQLTGLEALIARYNRGRAILAEALDPASGFRLQAPGRLASPQGFYGLAIFAEGDALTQLPRERWVEALVAEGFGGFGGSYGPVYRHLLYNMDPASYRLPEGGCPVAEDLGTARCLTLFHTWLGADETTLRTIAAVLNKVGTQAEALLEQPATSR